MFTDDPIADYDRYCAAQARYERTLPVCGQCGHPIQDDKLYYINDVFICLECMETDFKKDTEDYME